MTPGDNNRTIDLPADSLEATALERYEAAWQQALRGGLRPDAEEFLKDLTPLERTALRQDIDRLTALYERQLSGPTIVVGPAKLASPSRETTRIAASALSRTALDMTLPPDGATDPSVTLDSVNGSASDPGETLDPADASATDPGETLDPADPRSAEEASGKPIRISTRPAAPAVLPKVAGYEILGELGRGGMGVVYKARQTKLNRIVALKMVLSGAHAGASQLARFYIEAEAVAQTQHPNIVQIYEVSEHDGLPYFSLEYVDGGSLDRKLAGKPIPAEEAARMVQILSAAMACAHSHGVIHRDLKPANVLLSIDGLPKITDFGLAKRLESDSGQTRSGALMGTPNYMAPEQARGDTHEIGPLADIYALGVILYECLTGRTPFVGASILDTLQQVQKLEPVPPSRLNPRVPIDLETICLKCLQKEPLKRYPTADELMEDLGRFLAGSAIKARPIGKVERLWRWCKRNPKLAGLYSAVGALVVAVGVALAVMAVRSAQERETTAEAQRVAQQRLDQATEAAFAGRYQQAQVMLRWSDPLVETHPSLSDVRDKIRLLRDQVALYAEFKELLNTARYYGLFGPKGSLGEARTRCQELLALYDEIERKTGRAACGMPPLDSNQEQLLREEYFEAFLISAQVEWELVALQSDASARNAAIRKAIDWLERANQVYPDTWVFHYRRQAFLEKLGDAKRAEDTQWLAKARPTSALDRFWFGFAEHSQGEAVKDKDAVRAELHFRRAIDAYAGVVRLRPDHFWAYFDGAECHFLLGNLNDAVIGFTVCIQLSPEVPWPYFNRGAILVQQKQFDAAIEDLTRAVERKKDLAEAFAFRGVAHSNLDQADRAFQDFDQAVAINPNLAVAFTNRAEAYRRLNRFPEALPHYERAIQLDPKNTVAYAGRGTGYLALPDYARARDDFAKLIELLPKQADNYRMHGIACLRLQEFDSALRDWTELTKLVPASDEGHYNSAVTLKAMRKYEEAIQALGLAIPLKPNDSKSYLLRAQIYHQIGKFKEAEADQLLVLTKLKERRGEIFNDYGDLLRTTGRNPDALGIYEQSIKLLPKQTDAYVGIALIHVLAGKPELAETTFTRMMTANPDAARGYLRRAEFRRACGRWADALNDCDQAAKLDAKSPLPALVRASIRAARGEYREAIQDAELVLRSNRPDGHQLLTAACVWSLASQTAGKKGEAEDARQLAERAATLVGDSMTKGFLDLNFQACNRILLDPALAPVRTHATLLQLLPVLKKPKD